MGLQVISKLGDRHVVLGQKRSGVAECFFIVRDNFERVLQSNPSIPVDAEVQRNKETGLVSVVNHSDEKLPLCDFANKNSNEKKNNKNQDPTKNQRNNQKEPREPIKDTKINNK